MLVQDDEVSVDVGKGGSKKSRNLSPDFRLRAFEKCHSLLQGCERQKGICDIGLVCLILGQG